MVKPRFATAGPSFLGLGSDDLAYESPRTSLDQENKSLSNTADAVLQEHPGLIQKPFSVWLNCETSDGGSAHMYVWFPPWKMKKEPDQMQF